MERRRLAGYLALVQWLAGDGGPANGGLTPLSIAAGCGWLEVVQWLARNGGSVTQPDDDGATPLCIATSMDHLEVVQWLAGNGRSVTQPTITGHSPKEIVSAHGHDAVAAFLTAVLTWPAFKMLVACRLADDTKQRALGSGRLDPCAGPTLLAELVAAGASPKDALWAGSPDACLARAGWFTMPWDAALALSLPRWSSHTHPRGDVVHFKTGLTSRQSSGG